MNAKQKETAALPHPDRAFYRAMMVCMMASAFSLAALAIVRR